MSLDEASKTFYLPEELRLELKKPWGIAVFGTDNEIFKKCQKLIKEKRFQKVITVGDYCSLAIPSDVKIFDSKMEKKQIENTLSFSLKCSNPAGVIAKEVWPVIKQAIKENRNIFVNGEEDLLVIPAVLLSEENTVVIYGLPKKGVCLIEVSQKIKKELKELLKKFHTKPF